MIGSHNNKHAINHLKIFGFIFTMLLLMLITPAFTQERNGFGHDETYKAQDELNVGIDGHLTNPPTNLTKEKEGIKDSVSVIVKPTSSINSKAETPPQKKDEEETLSFNFLYFIIQKFKVSDIIN